MLFGFIGSVRAGDFNNDGYGSDAGLQTPDPADQLWEQDAAGVEDVAEANDTFGSLLG